MQVTEVRVRLLPESRKESQSGRVEAIVSIVLGRAYAVHHVKVVKTIHPEQKEIVSLPHSEAHYACLCGSMVAVHAHYCPRCGHALDPEAAMQAAKAQGVDLYGDTIHPITHSVRKELVHRVLSALEEAKVYVAARQRETNGAVYGVIVRFLGGKPVVEDEFGEDQAQTLLDDRIVRNVPIP